MKIQKTDRRIGSTEFFGEMSVPREKKVQDTSFDDTFQNYKHQAFKQKLSVLLKDIEDTGQKLSQNINIDNLIKYKKLISQFLHQVINNMLLLDKNKGFDIFGRRKTLNVVKKIDQKLEQLTQMVLNEQEDCLNILKTIQDIQGLLIDIKV